MLLNRPVQVTGPFSNLVIKEIQEKVDYQYRF